jgi:hypothetical protein
MTTPNENLRRISLRVDPSDADALFDNLYHGQPTHIMRAIVRALVQKLETEGKSEIYEFLDGNKELKLAPPKGDLV